MKSNMKSNSKKVVQDSEADALTLLGPVDAIKKNRFTGVRTVLVVLSARGMIFDVEALRQKIRSSYPDAAIFFRTTAGKAHGVSSPETVDLLIDFTGPGQKQGWLYARKLRAMSKYCIGRDAGLFRKRLYDRVFFEKSRVHELPRDTFEKEKIVQKLVLELSGVPVAPLGDATPDRSKKIALELPRLMNT